MSTCGGCASTWTGHRPAHCGTCHRTFSTVANFDLHRSPEGEHGMCLSPEDIPHLELRNGMWSSPAMPADVVKRFRKAS